MQNLSSGSAYQTKLSSIENLLRESGIEYKVVGDEAVSRCLFHSPDRHPSFSVNLDNGLYHCFSCGARGNLAHLISNIKSITYPEAVIFVNSVIGWAKASKWREDEENKNIAPPSFRISETDLALFTDVPEEFIAGRKLERKYADLFGVRWNPDSRSWILPIRDPYSAELWGWQEKSGDTRLFRNYPRGIKKSKTLFGMESFTDGSTAIVVESGLDAVRVSSFGKGNGLAVWGLPPSDFQFSLIFERTEQVILCFDNDIPGIRETKRICRNFNGAVKKLWVFDYGMRKEKDVGEMEDEDVMLGFANAKSALWWLKNR
jgi:DNA primase